MVCVGDHAAVGEHAVRADLHQLQRSDHHRDVEEGLLADPYPRGRRGRDPHVRLEQRVGADLEPALAQRLEHVAVHRPARERVAAHELPVDARPVPGQRVALVPAPLLRPQHQLRAQVARWVGHGAQLRRRYGCAMGSADVQGDLWSANPAGWAEQAESKQRPLIEAVLARLDPAPGTALLDAGCGSGLFAELPAERGGRVTGLDAAPGLIDYAGRRVPAGQFTVGELEALPYPDGAFDGVTAFNSVFYAADPRRVIAEMARVTGAGGHVVVTVGSGREHSDLPKLVDVLRPLLAPAAPDDDAQVPVTLSDIDQMRAELEAVGLELLDQVEVPFPWIYDDMDKALRGQTSSGPSEAAIRHSGRDAVVDALSGFFVDRVQPDGSIRMDLCFRYALARQPG